MKLIFVLVFVTCVLAQNWLPYEKKIIHRTPSSLLHRFSRDTTILKTLTINGSVFHDIIIDHPYRDVRSIDNVNNNVETLIKAEAKELELRQKFKRGDDPLSLDLWHHHDLAEVMNFIDSVAARYPQMAEKFTFGKSFEGRELAGLKLSIANQTKKKSVVVVAGIHAREWVSVTSAMGLVVEVLKDQDLIHQFDIYVIPVLNPDGYVYSWEVDRLWRKTRSNVNGVDCPGSGVDLNRNFDYNWSSQFGFCYDEYPGQKPFSEPESSSLAKFLSNLNQSSNISAFFDVHSYGNEIILPGGDCKRQSNVSHANREASKAFLAVTLSKFTSGSVCELIPYVVHGSSIDYIHHVLKVPIVITPELGAYTNAFMPTSAEVHSSVMDFVRGFYAVAKYALRNNI